MPERQRLVSQRRQPGEQSPGRETNGFFSDKIDFRAGDSCHEEPSSLEAQALSPEPPMAPSRTEWVKKLNPMKKEGLW